MSLSSCKSKTRPTTWREDRQARSTSMAKISMECKENTRMSLEDKLKDKLEAGDKEKTEKTVEAPKVVGIPMVVQRQVPTTQKRTEHNRGAACAIHRQTGGRFHVHAETGPNHPGC